MSSVEMQSCRRSGQHATHAGMPRWVCPSTGGWTSKVFSFGPSPPLLLYCQNQMGVQQKSSLEETRPQPADGPESAIASRGRGGKPVAGCIYLILVFVVHGKMVMKFQKLSN